MASEVEMLYAKLLTLTEQLADMTERHRCDCKHPACSRCEDYKENIAVLEQAPADAFVQVEAGIIASLRFPVMLRKMWSGDEVQRWLDERVDIALSKKKSPSRAAVVHRLEKQPEA